MNIFLVIVILGIVEGLTEFLPISSTGHMILVGDWLHKFAGADALPFLDGVESKVFEVVIQAGAILAMVVVYFRQFFELASVPASDSFYSRRGFWLLMLTTIPALAAGALLHKKIEAHMMTSMFVSIGLLTGGLWILSVEHLLPVSEHKTIDDVDWKMALALGCFQCLALWPGMSRSASMIMGALMLGLRRKSAVEYSFFAAVPVMVAASAYDLLKHAHDLNAHSISHIALGFVVAFVSALLAIKFFLRYVQRHTLAAFGWYRLALAAVVLVALRHHG